MIRISVIIPIYKAEKYLAECLNSVIEARSEEIELILVDDGSPDNCPAICDEYAKNHQNIRVIHQANGGQVKARNAGVAVASGEYVCFVDSDDKVDKGYFAAFNECISEHNPDVISCNYQIIGDGENKIIIQGCKSGKYEGEALFEIHSKMLSGRPYYTFGICPTLWTKCIKKSIFEAVSHKVPPEIKMGEDAAIVYASILKSKSVCLIDDAGYLYRQNLDSVTHTYNPRLITSAHSLFTYFEGLAKETNWQIRDQLNEYVIMYTGLVVSNEILYGKKYSNYKDNMEAYFRHDVLQRLSLQEIERYKIPKKQYFMMSCVLRRRYLLLYLAMLANGIKDRLRR